MKEDPKDMKWSIEHLYARGIKRKSERTDWRSFLRTAYELSNGSDMMPVNAFEITEFLGHVQRTLRQIHFCLEHEGLIKKFALGG